VDAATSEREQQVLSTIRTSLMSVLKDDQVVFNELMDEVKGNLVDDLIVELRGFADCIRDELALVQSRVNQVEQDRLDASEETPQADKNAHKIFARVFPESSISLWSELDSEGVVYGWEDQVSLYKIEGQHKCLAVISPSLSKSEVSASVRLFKFFNDLSDDSFANVVVTATFADSLLLSALAEKGIRVVDFQGVYH
jgi:hypothetical protein